MAAALMEARLITLMFNLPSRDYTEPEEITNEDIEKAACECRDLWRLGRSAIQDLALAVKALGSSLSGKKTGIAQIEGCRFGSEVLGRLPFFCPPTKTTGTAVVSISPMRLGILSCIVTFSARQTTRATN